MRPPRVLLALAFTALLATPAFAFPITVDPGGYTGRYTIPGQLGLVTGRATVDLPAGTYSIDNGSSIGGSSFAFTVDGGGQVSTTSAAAIGHGSTLTFRNAAVTFHPASYTGVYLLTSHLPTFFTGPHTLVLIPALVYGVDTGASVAGSEFSFSVDANGQVTTASAAAVGSGSTLTFNNVSITFDPVNYTGRYFVTSSFHTPLTGLETIVLVPALVYGVDTGAEVGGSAFYFQIDAAGRVSTASPAAVGSGSTLTFNNVSVAINPSLYTGRYFVTAFSPTAFTGPRTVVLVPGLVYGVDNGSFVGPSAFYFTVSGSGQVTTTSPAAVGTGNTLTFFNVAVHVDPTTYTGLYTVGGYLSLSGPVNISLIPSLLTAVVVFATGQTGTGYITPTLTQVTPPTLFTFLFTVVPQGFVQSLSAQVAGFVSSGNIATAGVGNGLSASLTAAGRLIAANNPAATRILIAILRRLDALTNAGQITPVVRDTLAAQINALIIALR